MRAPNSVIRYLYNFACGGSSHEIRIYDSYSKEKGLGRELASFKDPKIETLLAAVELTEGEEGYVRQLASERAESAIMDQDGNFISQY